MCVILSDEFMVKLDPGEHSHHESTHEEEGVDSWLNPELTLKLLRVAPVLAVWDEIESVVLGVVATEVEGGQRECECNKVPRAIEKGNW